MLRIVIFANLWTWSLVVSQPLFYAVALTRAQRELSAAAYVEVRQRINAVMNRRLPILYLSALATDLLLLWQAWRSADWANAAAAAVALLCLLADVVVMVRQSLPINTSIDGWTLERIPEDWESYRTRWFAAFDRRSVLLIGGYIVLLAGTALGAQHP